MKKLYRKGSVHPSPSSISDPQFCLSFLPAAVLTLAAALSAEDKEVLSYLLSCSSAVALNFDPAKSSQQHKKSSNHSPCFTCYCFSCYTSYWARWDSSPNRQLIHEIIDAFEEGLVKKKQGQSRREKRKNNNKNHNNKSLGLDLNEGGCGNGPDGPGRVGPEMGRVGDVEELGGKVGNDDEIEEKQGSVRKIVNLIGERIWGSVWG